MSAMPRMNCRSMRPTTMREVAVRVRASERTQAKARMVAAGCIQRIRMSRGELAAKSAESAATVDLETLNQPQLRAIAAEKGLTVPTVISNAALIEQIRAAAAPAEGATSNA